MPSCPIRKNPLSTAGGKPLSYDLRQNKNIAELGKDGDIIHFHELEINFGLNNSNYFQYLQLKLILRNCTLKKNTLANNETIDIQLRDVATGRGTVSKLCRLFCHSFFDCSASTKAQWVKRSGCASHNRSNGSYAESFKRSFKLCEV